jgi:hypothetical protein
MNKGQKHIFYLLSTAPCCKCYPIYGNVGITLPYHIILTESYNGVLHNSIKYVIQKETETQIQYVLFL